MPSGVTSVKTRPSRSSNGEEKPAGKARGCFLHNACLHDDATGA